MKKQFLESIGLGLLIFSIQYAQADTGKVSLEQIRSASNPLCVEAPVIQGAILGGGSKSAFFSAVAANYEMYRHVLAAGNKCIGAIDTLAEANKEQMDQKDYQHIKENIKDFLPTLQWYQAHGSHNISAPVAMGIRG